MRTSGSFSVNQKGFISLPIIIVVIIILVGLGFWFWQRGATSNKNLGAQLFTKAQNPLKNKVSETNPFATIETNPFKNIYPNPFR